MLIETLNGYSINPQSRLDQYLMDTQLTPQLTLNQDSIDILVDSRSRVD